MARRSKKWRLDSKRHSITNLAPGRDTGDCSACGPGVPVRMRRVFGEVSPVCRQKARLGRKPYLIHKGDRCEGCGFTGHPCQLDVDHINGDNSDHAPYNLRTLCANCHRLKTHNQRLQGRGVAAIRGGYGVVPPT